MSDRLRRSERNTRFSSPREDRSRRSDEVKEEKTDMPDEAYEQKKKTEPVEVKPQPEVHIITPMEMVEIPIPDDIPMPVQMVEDTLEPPIPLNEESVDNSEKENDESQQGIKRSLPPSEESQPKRKKRKRVGTRCDNPLMQLNEIKPGLKYQCESQEGPPHNPTFVFSVEVNGQKFCGRGNSKQKAKHDAAYLALSSLVQFKDVPMAANSIMCGTNDVDFSFNKDSNFKVAENGGDVVKPQPKPKKSLERVFADADKKNPCMLLNAVKPGLQYTLEKENSENPNQRFHMTVEFEGETFRGCGPNKKNAKAAAARAVLSQRFNVKFTCQQTMQDVDDKEVFTFPQHVADRIAQSVFEAFERVMADHSEYAKWKVLAGIVMSEDENFDNLKVITLGSGTKHLNGEYMSMNGAVLNDCHAEIISRRCLKEFFYTQLDLVARGNDAESIFERKSGDDKFCLKPNYKFHLFISTSPCGDARVFSVHDDDIGKVDRHPNRKARGLLRTKIESGEGTIPVKPGEDIQTWDGIIQGQQRYLTMSCSDKVASWNVLGLQGSLLSFFIEPVYLHSIVLGRLFHPVHMLRAIFGRYENAIVDLPLPFHLNKPKLCATTNLDSRLLSASPNFSINWTFGISEPEVVITRTGKTVQKETSRISKRSLFQRFAKIYRFLYGDFKSEQYTYADMKSNQIDYKKTKEQLNSSFKTSGLGTWVAKPAEQDIFSLI